jgi:hypothetical protein
MLHEVDEIRVYCGPAALMAVTGKRLPEVRSAINKARGFKDNQGVIGLSTEHLEEALDHLGIKYVRIDYPPAIKVPLKNFKHQMVIGADYIIGLNNHYVACHGDQLIDNHYRFGTEIDESKWKNKHVRNAWIIFNA